MPTGEHKRREGAANDEKVLAAIVDYTDEHGRPPTRVEVADITGLALNTVKRAVKGLVQSGILIDELGHRGLRLWK